MTNGSRMGQAVGTHGSSMENSHQWGLYRGYWLGGFIGASKGKMRTDGGRQGLLGARRG